MAEVRVVELRKEFGPTVAVRDVTTTFPSSTVTCLLGPSGCGKTTLLRMIAGLEEPTRGDVYFDGERVTYLPPRRRNIGMVFQYPVVYPGTNVYRNIELPLLEEKLDAAERRRRIDEVVAILGLEDSLYKDIAQLDMGTRQRVAVARTVARQPAIILFDEPITNVDVNTKAQLKRALKEMTKRLKKTVIYVTHDQTDAMTLADQIALMKDGEIVQVAEPRALYNRPNNVFGGWFLGNPGMNFLEHDLETVENARRLTSPLFPTPVWVHGAGDDPRVTVGIRPENIRLGPERTPMSVAGRVVRKAMTVGGRYLFTVQIGDRLLRAKVEPDIGRQLQGDVWVECPIEWITLFRSDGHRLEATLSLQ